MHPYKEIKILVVEDDSDILNLYESIFLNEQDTLGKDNLEDIFSRREHRKGLAIPNSLTERILPTHRYYPIFADSGELAIKLVEEELNKGNYVPVGFFDMKLIGGGIDGLQTIRRLKEIVPDMVGLIITAYTDWSLSQIADAFANFSEWLFFYKPFTNKVEIKQLIDHMFSLWKESRKGELSEIIGVSIKMLELKENIKRIARYDSSVLLTGETGVGKNLIAREIHRRSEREGKFMSINCSGMPESLLESELFGYEKGAFTGAESKKKGVIELADKGTIFLDEIETMPLKLQTILLQFLDSGNFRRVGGNEEIHSDVRVIAATNEDPQKLIDEGKIRKDLFYRLKVVILNVPPLRDRKSDIPLLAEHFLMEFCKSNKKSIRGFSKDAMDLLISHTWPGNVRELRHSIENAVIFCEGDEINVWDLENEMRRSDEQRKLEDEKQRLESGEGKVNIPKRRVISEDEIIKNIENMEISKNFSLPEFMDEIEKRIIKKVLERNNCNISATAKELKLPRDTTLRNKMKKLNIPFKKFKL